MNKEDIKALVKQVIGDMSAEFGMATEMSGTPAAPANATPNIGGFDTKLGSTLKRKLKDFEYYDDEEDEEE